MADPPSSGRAARWREHNAERRDRIVAAAIRVIESAPTGAELSVQSVANEAGLVRTVIYRHFDGKPELVRAVQARIVGELRDALDADLRLDRSLQQIVNAAVATYVSWADKNPNLYATIEREVGDGKPSELSSAIEHIAQRILSMVRLGADMLEMEIRGVDYAMLETVVFGMIGQIRGTVAHWIRTTPRQPATSDLTTILSRSLWFQMAGQAQDIGIELNPSTALREIFAGSRG
ncbi:MAG TPA: TetR/AcrR family transcriptional regulator [Aeromicrobium sp.]|nr:TetR/AcrR family transcriptional regulator [Aeromicrobium sp.]